MHKKTLKKLAISTDMGKSKKTLSHVLKKEQEPILKVYFSERVLHCKNPEHHHYVLTHCDKTGVMSLHIDKAYNLSKVNEELRDEVLGCWKKEDNGKYCLKLCVYIGSGTDARERKEMFDSHIQEIVGTIMHADAALLMMTPALMDAEVYVYYCDGLETELKENFGTVKGHLHTSIQK